MNAESARRNLYCGIIGKICKTRVKSALTGIKNRSELFGCHSERFLSVERNRAEGHCRKHNRGFELYLRRHNRLEPAVLGKLYLVGLSAEEGPYLHRLSQGVYGRVCYLTRI